MELETWYIKHLAFYWLSINSSLEQDIRSHLCQAPLKNCIYIIIVVAIIFNHFSRRLGSVEGFSRVR